MVVSAFRIGSLAQDSPTGMKCLFGAIANGGHIVFTDADDNAPYQITPNKKFIITRMCYNVGAGTSVKIAHDTTNPYTSGPFVCESFQNPSATVTQIIDVWIPIPADATGLFVFHYGVGTTGTITVFGAEV